MKRVCFGTMFKILYQACISSPSNKATNDNICAAIFSTFGDDFSLCGSSSSHLKSGHDNVPNSLQNSAASLSFEEADVRFQKYVAPFIKDGMKEAIVLAIKDILADDTIIASNEIVGYIDGYQKDKIIELSTFSFSAIVVSVLYYAITNVNNKDCKANIKEIDKEFIKSRINDSRKVYFEASNSTPCMPLENTLKDPTFNHIFECVYENKFPNTNLSGISIYSVDVNNRKINFRKTKQFIANNLTSYVMSREQVNRMKKVDHAERAGIQSFQKFLSASTKSKESILGETFLYVFMEQALGAPKILSKIEIDDIANKSKSDGIYFYRLERRGVPYHQLLFGASNILGNLKAAIDRVFDKIQNIEKNYDDEFLIVDNTLNQNIFPIDVAEYIKSILMPHKYSSNSNPPDMAFGCFLGYTVNVISTSADNCLYREDMKSQMKKDIDDIIPYIGSKISGLGLNNYEFYFYVIPFNDAINERVTLVDELIMGI